MLEVRNKIWDAVSNSMEKGFDIEPVYKEKYLKIEIKPYHGETNTYFYDNGMLKEVSHCVRLSKTLLDSVLK